MHESDGSFNPGLSCVGVSVQLLGAFSPEIPLSSASACYLSQYVYWFESVSSESVSVCDYVYLSFRQCALMMMQLSVSAQ